MATSITSLLVRKQPLKKKKAYKKSTIINPDELLHAVFNSKNVNYCVLYIASYIYVSVRLWL